MKNASKSNRPPEPPDPELEENRWPDDESETHIVRPVRIKGPYHSRRPVRPGLWRRLAFDPWRLAEALWRRRYWVAGAGCVFGLLGFRLASQHARPMYSASAELIHNDGPNKFRTSEFGDAFVPQPLSETAFRDILRMPEFFQRASRQIEGQVTFKALSDNLRVSPDRNVNSLTLTFSWPDPKKAAAILNALAGEAVRITREMQAAEAVETVKYLDERLKANEKETTDAKLQVRSAPTEPAPGRPPSPLETELQNAKVELAGLLAVFTEIHPRVATQRLKITALQNQLAEERAAMETRPKAAAPSPVTPADPPKTRLETRLDKLDEARAILLARQREARLFAANPLGEYRLFAPAALLDATAPSEKPRILIESFFCGFLGLAMAAAIVLLIEFSDRRLKTGREVEFLTGLPALATLGDVGAMTEAQQADWAFRALTMLQGRIVGSRVGGLVCGLTSAGHGEGRSTWINLLGRAASQRGLKVLTIATRQTFGSDEPPDQLADPGEVTPAKVLPGPEVPSPGLSQREHGALAHDFLHNPQQMMEQLMHPNSPPVVHIPLPGWVWNYDRRKQWGAALEHWAKQENVAVLVELPPAFMPESVLLAEHIPNVLWMSTEKADRVQTRRQLETLRHAGCNVIGAVLNRAKIPSLKTAMLRWVACGAVCLAAAGSGLADDHQGVDARPVAATNSFAVSAATHRRAPWQERLTLGAGDALTVSIYDRPELTRNEVIVGPDGRLTYLQAESVTAAGLTIDELRAKLDSALAAYYRTPRTIIALEALRSKKYFVLGSVARKGTYLLDRPTTVVEAVARAGGLETGLRLGHTAELADLQHAFLARRNERVPVDFEKLFLHGDFAQNIPLEPDDYLCFPLARPREAYLVGEVRAPGIVALDSATSVLGAIAMQGGFTDRAWKKRVLVIRGSLQHPQTFVLDLGAALSAASPDFRLEPRDIIYVHYRPWIRAEELLDAGASAFIQAAVIGWTGLHAGPIIRSPFLN